MKQTQQLSCTSHEKTINNRTKTKQKKKKNMIPTHCPPFQTLTSMNHLSTFPLPPIIYSNNSMTWYPWHKWGNLMDVEVSGKMIYLTYTWDLVQALESASPASCKAPATSIDSICPNNHPRRNKKSWKRIKLPTNRIILPRPMYTEPRAKRGRLGTQP